MHLSWSASGTSSCQSISLTTSRLLPANRETVNKPAVKSTAFLRSFSFFSFFSSCFFFLILFFVVFYNKTGVQKNRKCLFVPFIKYIVNVPPKEGITKAVSRSRMREFKFFLRENEYLAPVNLHLFIHLASTFH